MEQITNFLIEAVTQASKLITLEFEIKSKDDKGDLVTNFDFEIEKFLIDKFKKYYPNFDIVSEEFNSLKEITKNCFVIDPIDGTVNFAHKIPLWGIQVACIQNDETISSVIYLPKLKELYYADKTGAYCNDEQIFVQKRTENQLIFAVDGRHTAPNVARLENVNIQYRQTKVSCINYAWTAKGCFSGVIYKLDKPWDYIPGEYLVKQAGGIILDEKLSHMAACDEKTLQILKKYCGYRETDYK